MNYRRHIILLLFLLGGCIPIPKHHVIAPGVSGQVLDAETNTPLADVTLELQNMNDLSSTNGGEAPIVATTTTDDDGKFLLPAEKEWGMTVAFVGGIYRIGSFVNVSAPGYQSRVCECSMTSNATRCDNVTILLKKSNPRDTSENNAPFLVHPNDNYGFSCNNSYSTP